MALALVYLGSDTFSRSSTTSNTSNLSGPVHYDMVHKMHVNFFFRFSIKALK